MKYRNSKYRARLKWKVLGLGGEPEQSTAITISKQGITYFIPLGDARGRPLCRRYSAH